MKKVLGLALATVSLMAIMAPLAFAEESRSTKAMAGNNASAATVACVGTAVNAREQALGTGISAYTQAITAAYSARASALQSAYGLTTGNTAIRAAVKAAWSAFSSAMRTARNNWQKTRNSSWSAFRTSVKACKAPGSITDTSGAGMEASGQ